MQVPECDLKTFILDSGLVARNVVDEAEAEAKKKKQSIGDILVSNGTLTSDSLRRIKAYVLGIPFVSLKGRKIPFETLSLIPEPIARTHNLIAFDQSDKGICVAVLDTEDLTSIESVKKKIRLNILPRLTDEESIRYALLQYQKSLKEEFGDLITHEVGKLSSILGEPEREASKDELRKVADNPSIVRIVDTLLRHAMVEGTTDIHLEPMEKEMLVRYRIGGMLHDAMSLPAIAAPGIIARIKVLASLKLDQKNLPQEGRFKMETERDKVSFRVSLFPTYFGEKVVMRMLRETGEGFTLEALGFHGAPLERIHQGIKQTAGIILVSGPAASGKTTTLYTFLDILNTPEVSISTIEDPIEYQLRRVNQTQVNPAIGFTFAHGLRAILRQDPNIIMVGEIRDDETAALVVNAAQTGHLVLSTITSGSATDAISRLLSMGVEPAILASTLRTVVGQRLVLDLGDHKKHYAMTKVERAEVAGEEHFKAALKALMDEKLVEKETTIDDLAFYMPVGENDYDSHIGIQEVLSVSPAIRDLIMRGASPDAIEKQARKEGMLTLLEDGVYKAARGITSLDEVKKALAE